MIRVSAEPARTCNGCGMRCPVTLLTIGTSMLRVCARCFDALVRARSRLIVERLDSIEVA